MANRYEVRLDRTAANYVPLSPLTFLERAAAVFPNRTAVIHGERRYSWAQPEARCRRLASALRRRGIGRGDTLAGMAPTLPQLLQAPFPAPLPGPLRNPPYP